MRRRIYVDPESDLNDHTLDAYLFDEGDRDFPPPGQPFTICDTGALYDEPLWAEYERACEEASALRRRIVAKLIAEPYDEVELAAKAAMRQAHHSEPYDPEESNRIRQTLLDNAKSKVLP